MSEPGAPVEPVRRSLAMEGPAGSRLGGSLDRIVPVLTHVTVGAFADASRVVVLLDIAADGPLPTLVGIDVDELVVGEPRHDGERSIELFVHR